MKVISAANQKGGAGKSTLTVILATALAVDYGYRVCVIDADPQQSISVIRNEFDVPLLEQYNNNLKLPLLEPKEEAIRTQLQEQGKSEEEIDRYLEDNPVELTEEELSQIEFLDFPYPIFSLRVPQVNDFIDENADNYDVIFIDVPGRSDEELIADVLSACEVVLVPMQATTLTKAATLDFMHILQGIEKFCRQEGVPFSYFGISSARERNKKEDEMDEYAEMIGLPRFENHLRRVQGYDPPSTLFSYNDPDFRAVVRADAKAPVEIKALCDELIERGELNKEEVEQTA